MFRPVAAIFRLLQFCSKSIIHICLYFEVILRSHHRYALQSVYLVGCLIVNDWKDVSFLGRYLGRGGGSLGVGCVVCGFQYGLGMRGLWVSMFDVFWVLFGVVVLGGGFWPQVSIVCVCVCVCGLVHLVFNGSG